MRFQHVLTFLIVACANTVVTLRTTYTQMLFPVLMRDFLGAKWIPRWLDCISAPKQGRRAFISRCRRWQLMSAIWCILAPGWWWWGDVSWEWVRGECIPASIDGGEGRVHVCWLRKSGTTPSSPLGNHPRSLLHAVLVPSDPSYFVCPIRGWGSNK